MSDFFETGIKNLEREEDKEKCSASAKISMKKRSRAGFDSRFIESSEESAVECSPVKKYCILHGKCSYSTNNCKDLHAMVEVHKQKKKKNFKSYEKSERELNALIEKKIHVKRKKKRKTEKE